MTLIVGIRCKGGVVMAADSAATSSTPHGAPTVRQPTAEKLKVIDDQLVVGVSGPVGLGQRIAAAFEAAWQGGNLRSAERHTLMAAMREVFWGVVGIEFQVAQATLPVLGDHAKARVGTSTLIAMPVDGVPCLFELDHTGAPEEKTDLPFVAVGSGQLIADTFLAFLRGVFWKDRELSISDGTFAAFWTLHHAIEIHPGGVGGDIHIAVLEQSAGECRARWFGEKDRAEHKQLIDSAEEHVRSFRDSLTPRPGGESEIPAPGDDLV